VKAGWLVLALILWCGGASAAEHVLPFRANALTDAEWAHVRRNYLTDHDASFMVTPDRSLVQVIERARREQVQAARFDLDGDGTPELFLYLGIGIWCQSAGCATPVLRRTATGWEQVWWYRLGGQDDTYRDYPRLRLKDADRAFFFQDHTETFVALTRRYGVSPRLADQWAFQVQPLRSGSVLRDLRKRVPDDVLRMIDAAMRRRTPEDWAKHVAYIDREETERTYFRHRDQLAPGTTPALR
jgi:hypothetical protein